MAVIGLTMLLEEWGFWYFGFRKQCNVLRRLYWVILLEILGDIGAEEDLNWLKSFQSRRILLCGLENIFVIFW